MTFKVGDLIRYYGDLGLITGLDAEKDPIVFWFKEGRHAAVFANDVELLSRKIKNLDF
jgi:hypothetical protein